MPATSRKMRVRSFQYDWPSGRRRSEGERRNRVRWGLPFGGPKSTTSIAFRVIFCLWMGSLIPRPFRYCMLLTANLESDKEMILFCRIFVLIVVYVVAIFPYSLNK